MTKSELRTRYKNARQEFVLSLNYDNISAAIHSLSERLDAAQITTGTIGGYAAVMSELDPRPLLETLHEKGHDIALPWFENPAAEMVFKMAGGPLERGPFGIMQPGSDTLTVKPDTVLVPLVAADDHGNRLGQGQGHFDRYLTKLRENRPIVAIGLAWECQIADALPTDPWDQPLDYIATPDRLIKVTS